MNNLRIPPYITTGTHNMIALGVNITYGVSHSCSELLPAPKMARITGLDGDPLGGGVQHAGCITGSKDFDLGTCPKA